MPRKRRKISMSEEDKQRLSKENTSDDDSSEEETADEASSASERKLFAGLFEDASGEAEADEENSLSGFRLLHLQSIARWISQAAVCSTCKSVRLILQESIMNRQGFHIPMELVCSSCSTSTVLPTPTLSGKKVPEVNKRAVLAFRVIGAGQKKMEQFCAVMNMPPPLHHRSYGKHIAEVHRAVTTVADKETKQAAVRLSEHLRSLDDELEDGPLDVTFSADGSWATRGFTPLHGLVFAISQDTGEVLDYTLMSRHCSTCNYYRRIPDEDEFAKWKDQHEEKC